MSVKLETVTKNNKAVVVGTLLGMTTKEGKAASGSEWMRLDCIVRVVQNAGAGEEVNEITCPIFTMKKTKSGAASKIYLNLLDQMKTLQPAERVGFDAASRVRIEGEISENIYFPEGAEKPSLSHQLDFRFLSPARGKDLTRDLAQFEMDSYIMKIDPEVDREGVETGRSKLRVGVIGWQGRKVYVLNPLVENADVVDYINRNFKIGDTVTLRGYIRNTVTIEEKQTASAFGMEIAVNSVERTKRELIVADCDENPFGEMRCYAEEDIKALMASRAADIEQRRIDAEAKHKKKATAVSSDSVDDLWED